MARTEGRGLAMPLGVSAALHVAFVALFALRGSEPPPAMPPVYKVDLVAAPPGPRAMGQVTPDAPPATRPEAPPPPRADVKPADVAPVATKAPPKAPAKAPPATPTLPQAKPAEPAVQQRAGGGATGGQGTDVANVRTEGIAFPFPGYLNNIVRQIAVRFKPQNPNTALRAEMAFLLHRDGTISELRFVTRSGNYRFDLEARGAIEAAAGEFGPLPAGFRDDVLPVVFSFDPSLLR